MTQRKGRRVHGYAPTVPIFPGLARLRTFAPVAAEALEPATGTAAPPCQALAIVAELGKGANMAQTIAIACVAGYGLISLAGGVLGYVKANSRASLIAGVGSGVLLLASAALATAYPVAGLAIASVLSLLLVGRFVRSAIGKRPNTVAFVMIGGGVAVLVSAGLALS
jgi:uncharacterized membrane protein (UPF0136 family)